MQTDTIPSPAESVRSLVANPGTVAGLEAPAKVDQTHESTTDTGESTQEVAEVKEIVKKGLADSLVSDDPTKEELKIENTEVDSHAQKPDEKPAKYIDRLKAEAKNFANTEKQLRQQIEELKSRKAEAQPAEIEELRRQLAERDSILEETAIERTPKYQTQFVKPITTLADSTKALVGKFTETPGVFEQARAITDEVARFNYLKDNVPDIASTVFDRLAKLDDLTGERDAFLKDKAEVSKELAKTRGEQENVAVQRDFDNEFTNISKNLSIYRSEKAPALRETAKSLITGEAHPKDIIAAAYMAAAFPDTLSELVAARKTIATLEQRVKDKSADAARINGRGGESNGFDGSANFHSDGSPKSINEVLGVKAR